MTQSNGPSSATHLRHGPLYVQPERSLHPRADRDLPLESRGQPRPVSTVNPFTDVHYGDYFYQAVLWAVENGITMGTSATTFSPDATVTRAQVVTFLWRANGSRRMEQRLHGCER